MTTPRRAVFFDRDGTLIIDTGYLGDPQGVVLLPDAAAAVALAVRSGYLAVVISNQSGVARGLLSPGDVAAVNERMSRLLLADDARAVVTAFYYCPHLPPPEEEAEAGLRIRCACRKPAPGLYLQAAQDLGIDLSRSVALGDQERDLAAARSAGCAAAMRVGPPPLPSPLEAVDVLLRQAGGA